MPIRAVISPKFTYTQSHGNLAVHWPAYNATNQFRRNGMFDYPMMEDSEMDAYIFAPPVSLPTPGNGHNCRHGNRITVTSMRVKCSIRLKKLQMFIDDVNTTTYPATVYQLPLSNVKFFKFRMFLMEVDDDIRFVKKDIFRWFYSTYCYYRDPTVTPSDFGPNRDEIPLPGPISVHSNVLRLTTPWTGKFKILADRMFTISTKHPVIDIDYTIPIRREYVFDEVYDFTSKLIYPKIYLFFVPPLSMEMDVDPITAHDLNADSVTNTGTNIADVYSWVKLNFVDL